MGTLSTAAIAVIALVVALVLRRSGKAPKVVPWLMVVAGLGVTGLLGGLLADFGGFLVSLVGSTTAAVFGVAVPVLLAVVLVVSLVIGMHPKGSPSKSTPWLAFLAPVVFAASGGVFARLAAAGNSALASAAQLVTNLLSGL